MCLNKDCTVCAKADREYNLKGKKTPQKPDEFGSDFMLGPVEDRSAV